MQRGQRIITCPDNQQPAAVRLAWLGHSLRSCTRWPEKAGCGQECLAQIDAAPRECLVQSIVASWYAGKSCVICKTAIGEIVWHERPPGLRLADGTTREWKEIAAQEHGSGDELAYRGKQRLVAMGPAMQVADEKAGGHGVTTMPKTPGKNKGTLTVPDAGLS